MDEIGPLRLESKKPKIMTFLGKRMIIFRLIQVSHLAT